MMSTIAQGIVTQSTKKKLTGLETEKLRLEIQLLQEEMSQNALTREQILFLLHKFRDVDTKDRE